MRPAPLIVSASTGATPARVVQRSDARTYRSAVRKVWTASSSVTSSPPKTYMIPLAPAVPPATADSRGDHIEAALVQVLDAPIGAAAATRADGGASAGGPIPVAAGQQAARQGEKGERPAISV